MSFVETQFPPSIALGATGGANFSTDIITTFSGHEQRIINWAVARGRWNIATGIKGQADIDAVIAFFRARRGRAVGFRFKDWSDYRVTGGNIGIGDGTTIFFQLRKQYTSGSVTVGRDITKPVAGTLTVYVDAVQQTLNTDYAVDTTTGVIEFATAPANAAVITADFEFDVPVRFDTDELDIMMQTPSLGAWSNIALIEIRPVNTEAVEQAPVPPG